MKSLCFYFCVLFDAFACPIWMWWWWCQMQTKFLIRYKTKIKCNKAKYTKIVMCVCIFAFDSEWKLREQATEWLNKESNTIKWNICLYTLNVYKKLSRNLNDGRRIGAGWGIFYCIYPFDRFDTYDFAISIGEKITAQIVYIWVFAWKSQQQQQ